MLSKQQILERIFGSASNGGAKNLGHHIHRVRKKIDAGRPPLVHTVRGVGYILEERSL